jgi:hypothetical protein
MAELQKHPYHSSKLFMLIDLEKPGTGIFLMKESAKLHRPQKEREIKEVGTHQELLALDGFYKKLYEIQFSETA